VAKAAAFWQVANYREAYQLQASTGILFNHESPLRPERFVTQKIVAAACRIANGTNETLTLGNIDIARDWGWAPDYVEAMWQMLQQKQADDYVIATGQTHKLSDFINVVFRTVGLDWQEHVRTDPLLLRPTDIAEGHANPAKAQYYLGWKVKHTMVDVARLMVEQRM
jgi:GDPmannose 4,6-dehydratase